MSITEFASKLAQLPGGVTFDVTRDVCDRLFAPGLHTAQGRGAMYTVANEQLCDIRWGEGVIHFVKREIPQALALFANAMKFKN